MINLRTTQLIQNEALAQFSNLPVVTKDFSYSVVLLQLQF